MVTSEDRSAAKLDNETKQRIRRALNDTYLFVRGQQTVRSFEAFTFEDALDQQIEEVEGAGTSLRPNKHDRVLRIYQKILAAADDVAAYAGLGVEDEDKVNTPLGGL